MRMSLRGRELPGNLPGVPPAAFDLAQWGSEPVPIN